MPDACTAGSNNFGGYALFVDFGGIIMSDASGANAMGVYGVSLAQGGSVSYVAMWKFYCWGDGPSESASDTTAWSAVYGNGTDVIFPAGESTYNVYLIPMRCRMWLRKWIGSSLWESVSGYIRIHVWRAVAGGRLCGFSLTGQCYLRWIST
jgi:hypothetical protein